MVLGQNLNFFHTSGARLTLSPRPVKFDMLWNCFPLTFFLLRKKRGSSSPLLTGGGSCHCGVLVSCQDHHHDHKDKAGQWPARHKMELWGQDTVQTATFWGVLASRLQRSARIGYCCSNHLGLKTGGLKYLGTNLDFSHQLLQISIQIFAFYFYHEKVSIFLVWCGAPTGPLE